MPAFDAGGRQAADPDRLPRVLSLREYLRHIGMPQQHMARDVACELCGQTRHTVIRDSVQVEPGLRASLHTVACDRCGYLFQNPRFGPGFYAEYYNRCYRQVLDGSGTPDEAYVQDQVSRGEYLFRSLAALLERPGRMLDVGCSAGGVMQAFLARGWDGFGTDPDAGYVEYGIRRWGAPLAVQAAEDMALAPASYDLVVITGSLEHVVDPNLVLALCRQAARPDALLVVEGRGLAQARQTGSCGHNHRRFLSAASIGLLMCKHGWEPLCITDQELCGPTRPQSVFGIARAGARISDDRFATMIETQGESPAMICSDFERWEIR